MTRADVEFAAGFDDTAKMTDAEYLIEERRVGKILAA
jgi:hypothetical protein